MPAATCPPPPVVAQGVKAGDGQRQFLAMDPVRFTLLAWCLPSLIGDLKAAEDNRTPRRFAMSGTLESARPSWRVRLSSAALAALHLHELLTRVRPPSKRLRRALLGTCARPTLQHQKSQAIQQDPQRQQARPFELTGRNGVQRW